MNFDWWSMPAVQLAVWSLFAGFVGFLWGMSEIVGAFKTETGRALNTGGAWLLIFFNFFAAAAIYLVVANLVVGANTWLVAILVGLAWPTVVRNLSFKLAQPLQPEPLRDAAAVRLEEAYAAVQALARQLINATLTRQRMQLVAQAVELDMRELEKMARLAVIAAPLPPGATPPPPADDDASRSDPPAAEEEQAPKDFITLIMQRQVSSDIKKALLAAFILEYFDRRTLEEMVRDLRKQRKAPKPPEPDSPS
ncbi:MAG TPA: hypothetical protein PL187_14950 [Caldilinea sp.]|nr:hypothetical protein [Caldilinea sp.]